MTPLKEMESIFPESCSTSSEKLAVRNSNGRHTLLLSPYHLLLVAGYCLWDFGSSCHGIFPSLGLVETHKCSQHETGLPFDSETEL